MKTRLLLVLAMVLFFVGLVGTSLAAPPLPDDVKIIPPDQNLPPENIKFFGKSGKWAGTYSVPMSGGKAEVLFVFEKINKQEAQILITVEGSVGIATEPKRITADFIRRRGKILLSFSLPSSSDARGETTFWVRNDGVLEGERTARGNFGMSTSTFILKPLD